MEKFSRQKLENIQAIFEEQTGINLSVKKRYTQGKMKKIAAAVGVILCFLTLSAFAYSRLSGDEVGFRSAYRGDGVFEIVVTNLSDREFKLQDQVKLMRWSSGKEVEGDAKKIIIENKKIAAHSEETITIDLSKGYDVAALEEPLPSGDWYYFILTNNYFAFGHDWMCSIHFNEDTVDTLSYKAVEEERKEEKVYPAVLRFEEWIWPTVSEKISGGYGIHENGTFSDHINIAGNKGDEVYAVADGTVKQAGFDRVDGIYVLVDLGEGIVVKYGHLEEILAEEGESVKQGQRIAKLGGTGLATGPNLSFTVYADKEAINPLAE